jgi:hypothetical protein
VIANDRAQLCDQPDAERTLLRSVLSDNYTFNVMYTLTSFEYDALTRAYDMSLKVLLHVIAFVYWLPPFYKSRYRSVIEATLFLQWYSLRLQPTR